MSTFRVERNPIGGFWPSVVMFEEAILHTGHTKACVELADRLNQLFVVAPEQPVAVPELTNAEWYAEALRQLQAMQGEVSERAAHEQCTAHGSRGRTRQAIYRRIAQMLEPIIAKFPEMK